MGIITIIVFWGAIARLWVVDGPRLPLIFIGIWIVSLLALSHFAAAGYLRMSFQAVLAVILLLIGQYKASGA